MSIDECLIHIINVYKQELFERIIKTQDTNNKFQVVEVEIDKYRLFIDINNNVYIESGKKMSGKTFGKRVGYLKDMVIYLE